MLVSEDGNVRHAEIHCTVVNAVASNFERLDAFYEFGLHVRFYGVFHSRQVFHEHFFSQRVLESSNRVATNLSNSFCCKV